MKYSDLLKILIGFVANAKAKLPKAIEWLNLTLDLLEIDNPAAADSLQLVEPTAEETCLEEQLSQALTAEGTQAVFDGSRLRKLVALAADYGPQILALLKMFGALGA